MLFEIVRLVGHISFEVSKDKPYWWEFEDSYWLYLIKQVGYQGACVNEQHAELSGHLIFEW